MFSFPTRAFVIIASLVTLSSGGCGDSNSNSNSTKSLTVRHRGDQAVLTDDSLNQGFFILKLHAVKGGGTVQIDGEKERPLHSVDLIRYWNDESNPLSLAKNPPRGTLTGVNHEGVTREATLEFYDPKWDKVTNTHTYRVKIIPAAGQSEASNSHRAFFPPAAAEGLNQAAIQYITTNAALPVGSPLTELNINSAIYTYTTKECDYLVDSGGEHHDALFSGPSYPNFMQFCRPHVPEGYYFLSDAAVASQFSSQPFVMPDMSLLVVKESGVVNGENSLAAPVDAVEVWRDKGSGGDYDFTIFQPLAPNGYVCLGVFVQEGYEDPQIPENYRCVRSDLVVPLTTDNISTIWTDSHSGAKQDVILGTPNPMKQVNGLNLPNYGITLASAPGDDSSYPQCSAEQQQQEQSCSFPYMLNTDIPIVP